MLVARFRRLGLFAFFGSCFLSPWDYRLISTLQFEIRTLARDSKEGGGGIFVKFNSKCLEFRENMASIHSPQIPPVAGGLSTGDSKLESMSILQLSIGPISVRGYRG